MEKTKIEIIEKKEDLIKAIDFAILTTIEQERSNYSSDAFPKVIEEIKKLDVFDFEFLLNGIEKGEFVVFMVTKNSNICLVSALNRLTSRLMFFVVDGLDASFSLAQKLVQKLNYLCTSEAPLTIMAFFSGAKLFERLGFVKLKQYIMFKNIMFVPFKQSAEQYDSENY